MTATDAPQTGTLAADDGRARPTRRSVLLGGAAAATVGGCARVLVPQADRPVARADLGGLPYHPLPFHLDLCVLSYQLYAQSLVWPIDAHYEKFGGRAARDAMMARVRNWATSGAGGAQAPRVAGYRGPGGLAAFPDNAAHDPILFRYDGLRPWAPALSIDSDTWTELRTPEAITGRIAQAQVCYRLPGAPETETRLVSVARGGRAVGARDVLYAFEGGTGDKGEPDQPASQSLLGFVLSRHIPSSRDYDIHIVFRGSRSGQPGRAFLGAISTRQAAGNPDWVTNLGFRYIASDLASDISATGRVHRGFARATRSALPRIMTCLSDVARDANGRAPRRIFVTGHSLGGALAQHLSSAVLLGDRYGPDGRGPAMPEALRGWPWTRLKLITFSAPVGGGPQWASALTVEKLQSVLYSQVQLGLTQTDPNALAVSDPAIAPRLVDPARPAAYRVLDAADPVATRRFLGGRHVGQSVYITDTDPLGLATPEAHEPTHVSALMRRALREPELPEFGWRRHDLQTFAPGVARDFDGDLRAFDALFEGLDGFHTDQRSGIDRTRLRADFELFRGLASGV